MRVNVNYPDSRDNPHEKRTKSVGFKVFRDKDPTLESGFIKFRINDVSGKLFVPDSHFVCKHKDESLLKRSGFAMSPETFTPT